MDPSSFRSRGRPPRVSKAEPDRSPRVSCSSFRGHPVATTHVLPDANRASPLGAGSPSTYALRRFTCVRCDRAPLTPSDIPSRVGSSLTTTSLAPGTPGRRPCFQCRVPYVWAPGLDFHLLTAAPAWRTRPRASRAPVRSRQRSTPLVIGRSRGGPTTKVHAVVDAPSRRSLANPVRDES